jgi:hypothetical protein
MKKPDNSQGCAKAFEILEILAFIVVFGGAIALMVIYTLYR